MDNRSMGRIQFGPSSVIYLVVSALILFAAVYTQANLLFWALGLMVGALGVSLLFALITLRGVQVHRLSPTRGVAGEPLVLRYHLENRSRLAAFSVEIIETWSPRWRSWRRAGPLAETPPRLKGRPFGWVLHIGPNQTIQAEAACWPMRRGVLTFQRIIIRSGFPFGVLRKAVEFRQPGEVLIYPPLRRLNRQTALSLSSSDINNAKHTDRGGGMDEFFGLRPYRPGDGYKLIDWKHSAKTSNLVSREMTRPRPPRMMILLDLTKPGEQDPQPPPTPDAWREAQEEAINLAASLIREAYLHDIHVGLAVEGAPGPALPMHHSQAHRQRLMDSLARLAIDEPDEAPKPLPAPPTVIVRPQCQAQPDGQLRAGACLINVNRPGNRLSRGDWAKTQPNTRRDGLNKRRNPTAAGR